MLNVFYIAVEIAINLASFCTVTLTQKHILSFILMQKGKFQPTSKRSRQQLGD